MADKAIDYWDNAIQNLAQSTKIAYQSDFNRFIAFIEMSSEDFYEFANRVSNSSDRRDRAKLVQLIQKYRRSLEEMDFAPGTIRNKVKPIISFLQANEVDINLKRLKKNTQVSIGQKVILRDQIRQIFDSVGSEFRFRNRALIMLLKDSGLRVSDASRLSVRDYRGAKAYKNEAGEEFRVFPAFKTQKTGHYAFIHLGPEAVGAIDDYLEEREEDEGTLSPDGFLFSGRGGESLSGEAMTSLFYRLCEPLRKKKEKVSAHSFRKYHRTQLEGAGMNTDWIKRLQGKVADTYSHPEQNGLLTKRYIDAYENLRVFDSNTLADIERDKRLADLETSIENQRKEIDALTNQLAKAWVNGKIPDQVYEVILEKNEEWKAKDPEIRRLLELINARKIQREVE